MSTALKTCPFCGEQPVDTEPSKDEEGFISVQCWKCCADGPSKSKDISAIKAWNTRNDKQTDLEHLAHEEHEIWSHWMKYLFSKCMNERDHGHITGNKIIPNWAVNRWSTQMNRKYCNLSEEEKQSDRDVVIEHHKSLGVK